MPISSKQRAQLRGLAMELDTIIQVGKGGISDSLVESVNAALKARELVKGRVLENSMLTAREACDALCERCGAEGVQVYVDKLKAELADTMAMCGAHKLSDIKRSMIFGY